MRISDWSSDVCSSDLGERAKARRNFSLPGGGTKGDGRPRLIKSLGELVTDDKDYLDWAEKGAKGQIDLSYDDVWATDLLAMARGGSTNGEKALMMTTPGYSPQTSRLPGLPAQHPP